MSAIKQVMNEVKAAGTPFDQTQECAVCKADTTTAEWRWVGDVDYLLRVHLNPRGVICLPCLDRLKIEWHLSHCDELFDEARVPGRYRHATRETVAAKVWAVVEEWLRSPEILVIHGPTGTGKSHLAAAVLRAMLLAGKKGAWWPVPDAVDALRDLENAQDVMHRLKAHPWLVLDDLAAERLTEYGLERMATLVAYRWDWQAPTIVTTNATPKELQELHPRMASRILGGTVIGLTGKDRRLTS